MKPDMPRIADFIIGGTEKAGTTSVFTYLGEHPGVCGSSSKETDFFRHEYSGNPYQDRASYARHFSTCSKRARVIMEASPGYLGEAATVAPRISELIPNAKLLFILRDPVERLYSSYNFHKGRLDIDKKIHFENYVDKCLAFDRGEADADELGLGEWYLKMLRFGCYAEYIRNYNAYFAGDQVKIMFFEQFTSDISGFMKELSIFLRIDINFWDNYEFRKTNVTFSGSNKMLHRAAITVNNRLERVLRQRPRLKHALVRLYKMINQAREGYDPMPASANETLKLYYRPHNEALRKLLGKEHLPGWSC